MMIEDVAGEAYVKTWAYGEEVLIPESEYLAHYSPAAIRRRVYAFLGIPAPVEEGRDIATA